MSMFTKKGSHCTKKLQKEHFYCNIISVIIIRCYICIYIFTYRTQATKEYIHYSQQHRKIWGRYWHRWSFIYFTCDTFGKKGTEINTCSTGDATVGTFRQTLFHAHTTQLPRTLVRTRYARPGLAVKGNQIQKGSSQLVRKVDSTCKDLSELWISSGFTEYSSENVQEKK